MEIHLNQYQDDFIFSERRYPAMVAGIATGKTFSLLTKVVDHCLSNSNALALIVRKEFTDLRDSTIKDFLKYFPMLVVDSNKECKLPNKSTTMFRHGGELNVLKNINLSFFAIEQAEEFETEETFTFLRDRLRRKDAKIRQGCIIANANGHNWVWRLWKNSPASKEFYLVEATTFDNEKNLPADFIEDLKRMEVEAPSHYRRYVMNSHEDVDTGDLLIPYQYIEKAQNQKFDAVGTTIYSIDIARMGDDRTIHTVIQKANRGWKQVFLRSRMQRTLNETIGEIIAIKRERKPTFTVLDEVGMGAGPLDVVREFDKKVIGYCGGAKATSDRYFNKRSEDFFKLQKMFYAEEIDLIRDDEQSQDLSVMKFGFKVDSKRYIISKDQLKKDGIRSPDGADALSMAVSVIPITESINYAIRRAKQSYKRQYVGGAAGW